MLTERGNIKECFQGQSRNWALQTGGMTCLAERFSEREKQQKVQSVMLPVFNTDQKIPHIPTCLTLSNKIEVKGGRLIPNSLIILLKYPRRPKAFFMCQGLPLLH